MDLKYTDDFLFNKNIDENPTICLFPPFKGHIKKMTHLNTMFIIFPDNYSTKAIGGSEKGNKTPDLLNCGFNL